MRNKSFSVLALEYIYIYIIITHCRFTFFSIQLKKFRANVATNITMLLVFSTSLGILCVYVSSKHINVRDLITTSTSVTINLDRTDQFNATGTTPVQMMSDILRSRLHRKHAILFAGIRIYFYRTKRISNRSIVARLRRWLRFLCRFSNFQAIVARNERGEAITESNRVQNLPRAAIARESRNRAPLFHLPDRVRRNDS